MNVGCSLKAAELNTRGSGWRSQKEEHLPLTMPKCLQLTLSGTLQPSFQEGATGMIIMVNLLDCVMHAPLSVQQRDISFFPFFGYAVMVSNACSVLAPKEHASPFCSTQITMCSLTSIFSTCISAPALLMLILLLPLASGKPETSTCQATT